MLTATTTGQAAIGSLPSLPPMTEEEARQTGWASVGGRRGQAVRMGPRRGSFPEAVATETTCVHPSRAVLMSLCSLGPQAPGPSTVPSRYLQVEPRRAGLRKEPTEVQPLDKKPQSPRILSSATTAETWVGLPGPPLA